MAGIPIRNGNRHGGPGSREEGVGLGRPLGADAQARWTPRRSPTCCPEPARPLTSSPGRPSCSPAWSSRRAPATDSRGPGSGVPMLSWRRGAGARRISASAEPRRAGPSGPRLPSSRLRRCRCSGPGALRIRTFHSSFHAPSPGQSSIGSAKSDVTASSPSRPRPSPSREEPERAIGAPLPPRSGVGEELLPLCADPQPLAASPTLRPACHLPPLSFVALISILTLFVGPTFSIWALGMLHQEGGGCSEILKRIR